MHDAPQQGALLTRARMCACLQVISTALGYVLPNLISRKATQHAASVLYTVFGLRLLWIAWHSKPQETNQVSHHSRMRCMLLLAQQRVYLRRCSPTAQASSPASGLDSQHP